MLYESHSFVIMSKGISVFDVMKKNLIAMKTDKHTIKRTVRLGIDDLHNEFLFHGASQGDETRTNSLERYNDSDGWLYCIDNNIKLTTEDINKWIQEQKNKNKEYIKQLKKSGQYGKTTDGSITFEFDYEPEYDKTPDTIVESARFTILNFE